MALTERLREIAHIIPGSMAGTIGNAADAIEELRAKLAERDARIKELERQDFREMREMLRAMQAGELTVSRGIEILEMWHAGNWNDDMLPPVRQDLIEEDSMPVEIIDRCNQRITALEAGLREAREALDNSTRHFGIKRLGNSTLADSNARSANHNAIANIDKLLERLCQRGADVERLR